jgi:hypothetical protein
MKPGHVLAYSVFLLFFASPARAEGASDIQAMKVMLESMKIQIAQLQQTIDSQSVRIEQLESKTNWERPAIPQKLEPSAALSPENAVKSDIIEQFPWMKNLTLNGDVRLRYEAINRESNEESVHDRNRFRFRVRWGLEKVFNDEWRAGFGLVSGEDRFNSTSTNQSLDEEFSFKNIAIQKAYAIYTPQYPRRVSPVFGAVEIGAGKVENPYVRDKWNTSIIWDADVMPEGIYEKVDFRIATFSGEAFWNVNTLMGQFVVNEDSDSSPGDLELLSYGVGTTYQWKKAHDLSFKFTYYDWQDYAQFLKNGLSVSPDSLGGNDRNVDDFKILNFYAEVNVETATWWGNQPFKVFGDYAQNIGIGAEDEVGTADESLRNPAFREDSDQAFSIGISLGRAKEAGTWSFTYEYLYIEPNAVVGNFSESDLGVGFANNKGHKLGWKYMLLRDLEFAFTAWITERVDKTILTYGVASSRPFGDDDEVLRTQLDLSWKF